MVALSVIAHEVPQELGDFGVLISQGLGRTRAIFWNMVSGLTTFAGGLLAWFLLRGAQNLIPYVLALSASSFIYIALADLIPQMHKKSRPGQSVSQLVLILAGISTIIIIIYHKHA
jgi:zinc and cadmium transporter